MIEFYRLFSVSFNISLLENLTAWLAFVALDLFL